ncbi:hypothetical protein BDV95DRAFT_595807 [Massariosphaeria phaeospora]|uniref:Uncharacterized protein n=1 Tax=Massariosphaeria phaeospora TaxID=100035 RepID=A0A7C8M4P6_9PLEO|nr:hypothetical protein BDV95DRAFT_595807 [Massariosphaeria phaeospora]
MPLLVLVLLALVPMALKLLLAAAVVECCPSMAMVILTLPAKLNSGYSVWLRMPTQRVFVRGVQIARIMAAARAAISPSSSVQPAIRCRIYRTRPLPTSLAVVYGLHSAFPLVLRPLSSTPVVSRPDLLSPRRRQTCSVAVSLREDHLGVVAATGELYDDAKKGTLALRLEMAGGVPDRCPSPTGVSWHHKFYLSYLQRAITDASEAEAVDPACGTAAPPPTAALCRPASPLAHAHGHHTPAVRPPTKLFTGFPHSNQSQHVLA